VKSYTVCEEQTSPFLWNSIRTKQSCLDRSDEKIICCTDEVRRRQQGRENC